MKISNHHSKSVRHTLFVLATFFLTGGAHAEWVLLGRNDAYRVYLDQQLIQRSAGFAQLWQLMDFSSAQWLDERTVIGSIKSLVEYDCSEPRSRMLASQAFSEQMEAGRLVSDERIAEPKWEPIGPNSASDQIRQLACGNDAK
jgi:hypothetical protein